MNHNQSVKVSVVIPSLNRPKYVVRAVNSALAQTLKSIEVIVVVDGPDEITVEELEKIKDSRLKVISLPVNVGCADSRNAGVKEAQGQWIAFLDDDDEWLPQKLELQLVAAENSSATYPMVASRYLSNSEENQYILPKRLPSTTENISEFLFVRKSLFERAELIQTSTYFTSKHLLEKVPFTHKLRKHVDWDWLIRASSVDGVMIEVLPETLVIRSCEQTRERISNNYDWKFGRKWIRSIREYITPQAYAGFFLRVLTLQATLSGDWKAFFPLFNEAIKDGRPRMIDILAFILLWFMPINLRHQLRSLVLGITKTKLKTIN